jgi:hypothetical protein
VPAAGHFDYRAGDVTRRIAGGVRRAGADGVAGTSAYGIGTDLAILAGGVTLLVAVAARMFPRIVT